MLNDAIVVTRKAFTLALERYTSEEQEALEWLWGYAHDVLGGSRSGLAKAMGMDYADIHALLLGNYGKDMEPVVQTIRTLKNLTIRELPLVKTIVTQRIIDALNYAKDFAALVSITGPTGRGKTYAAKYWARENNHGRARYLRVPSGCTRNMLVVLLCRSLGIGVRSKKRAEMELQLFDALSPRNVIIFDEAGHLVPHGSGGSPVALEFVRDLHDMCECGVCLIFTDVYLKEIRHGRHADFFEQFIGRDRFPVAIPQKVTQAEVNAAVEAFRPNPPRSLTALAYNLAQRRDGKLRTLFEDLRRACDYAKSQDRLMSDEDLRAMADWRKSGGVWPEE